jgi:hypothetical protein
VAANDPAKACAACAAAGAVVMGPDHQPGHAVVGGVAPAPATAIAGGFVPSAEPAPIGVIQGRYAYTFQGPSLGDTRPAAPGALSGRNANQPGPGLKDSAVMPTSFATEPYDPVGPKRPHILTHVLNLDTIGRRGREERERRAREKHASISYQPSGQPQVDDLPARLVYRAK